MAALEDKDEEPKRSEMVDALVPDNSGSCDRCGVTGVAFAIYMTPWSRAEWCISCGIALLTELIKANDAFLKARKAKR